MSHYSRFWPETVRRVVPPQWELDALAAVRGVFEMGITDTTPLVWVGSPLGEVYIGLYLGQRGKFVTLGEPHRVMQGGTDGFSRLREEAPETLFLAYPGVWVIQVRATTVVTLDADTWAWALPDALRVARRKN